MAGVSSLAQGLSLLAERQHGSLSLSQVLEAGGRYGYAVSQLGQGRWVATAYAGVYRVAGAPQTWHQAVMALVLAVGPEAGASHRSAAALLGFPGFDRRPVEVVTHRPWRQRVDQAVVHTSRVLKAEHLLVVDGIPTTMAARTLVDLAGVLSPGRLARALDNCLASGGVTFDELCTATAELAIRGRRGIRVMRRLLDERGNGIAPPASELEARFLKVIRAAGLPEPVRQADVGDGAGWVGRVDFVYPQAKVLIELDGRRYHSALLDLEADRSRDNRLVAGGWRVMRVTWAQLRDRPDEVVGLIRRLLRIAA
jgi:hypothetical protein